MSTKSKWLIRIAFWLYMLYVYLTVVRHNSFYSFLLLNTFLAYIPIELSFHIKERQTGLLFYPLLISWLLFYPNAPYILTDLFHLARMTPYNPTTGLMSFNLHMWLNFTNLVSSALAAALIGNWSLQYVADVICLRFKLHNNFGRLSIVTLLLLLSSVGIYVGRFLRLHTAYLFLNPNWVIEQLLNMWSIRMLAFVCFMFLLQLIIWLSTYLSYLAFRNMDSKFN